MQDDIATRKLISRIMKGDGSAREELTARYYKSVVRYCAYRSGSLNDAEDLAQETFLKLFSYFDTYTDKHAFRAYLFRIASNVCCDYLSSKRDTDELDETVPSGDVQGSAETAMVIRDAVAKLPDEQREAVILYYFNGMKTKEIAAVQNVPPATVRTRLGRGRDKLKEILTKEGLS